MNGTRSVFVGGINQWKSPKGHFVAKEGRFLRNGIDREEFASKTKLTKTFKERERKKSLIIFFVVGVDALLSPLSPSS